MKRFSQVRQSHYILLLFAMTILNASAATLGQDWQNPVDALDVSDDGARGVDDFHQVFSEMFAPLVTDGFGPLPKALDAPPFVDIDGDNNLAAVDLVQLINAMPPFPAGIPAADTTVSGPVSILFEFTDASGNPISTASIGDNFYLTTTLVDLRDESAGIFGAYMDLVFDREFVTDTIHVEFASTSQLFDSPGALVDSGIDEIGAIPNEVFLDALSDAEFSPSRSAELFTVEFTADQVGEFTVDGNEGYALVLGILDAIDPTFPSATLTIVPEPTGMMMWLIAIPSLLRLRKANA